MLPSRRLRQKKHGRKYVVNVPVARLTIDETDGITKSAARWLGVRPRDVAVTTNGTTVEEVRR